MSIKSLLIQILVLKVIFMHVEEKFNIKRIIIEILVTILGSFVMAFGISLFLLPNQLSSGGLAGIATITYYLLNIPMGALTFALNIPLFFFAFDLEEYLNNRGLTIDYKKELPGFVSEDANSIIEAIEQNNYDKNSLIKFREKYITNIENCTKKIVQFIEDLMF